MFELRLCKFKYFLSPSVLLFVLSKDDVSFTNTKTDDNHNENI